MMLENHETPAAVANGRSIGLLVSILNSIWAACLQRVKYPQRVFQINLLRDHRHSSCLFSISKRFTLNILQDDPGELEKASCLRARHFPEYC